MEHDEYWDEEYSGGPEMPATPPQPEKEFVWNPKFGNSHTWRPDSEKKIDAEMSEEVWWYLLGFDGFLKYLAARKTPHPEQLHYVQCETLKHYDNMIEALDKLLK